ncbi:hypothetical protein CERSUDRAFT_87065 [Gelatoporia subvermispora B]|uniref:DUF6533 domain-containing protein n=1 Tax=Ceriporiopsis subvermispora (strain B) TaxID=914234 RepID=M2R470_CERS8|nr:hypothetical protein CERSUDRAFT_87065 [Gelatoporia subvermispora B]
MIEVGFNHTTSALDLLHIAWQSRCYVVAATVLVIYDQIVTFSSEIEFIWNQKFSYVSALFHLNRCTVFAWAIVYAMRTFLPLVSMQRCRIMALLICAFCDH